MGKTREIKKRIKAVANIRRITKTMQMIATAKFQSAMIRASASKPYAQGIYELVTHLAATAGNIEHPLAKPPAESPGRVLLLVITSDRGMCGAYNSHIIKLALETYQRYLKDHEVVVELIGRKGVAFCRFNGIDVAEQHQIGDKPTYEQISQMAERYMAQYTAGRFDSMHVVYQQFISNARQVATLTQLLPLSPEVDKSATSARTVDYEFSPPAEELLRGLLPEAVKTTLYQAISEALVSEHIMRMVAMKAATDNAGKMGKTLTRKFNRARQTQITTELTEIISGSAALE
ncbi:MAG: ATP synthase F1 subunit gamma [Phycisphaerales bacterium]|nr:ATP synthase F1 subunit gamma [Phycisphaerales bacterium]